jgi:hypothetical protein
MSSTDWVILAIVVGVLAVAAIAATAYWRSRRTMALRDRFGPEYDRMLGESGSRRDAERELRTREQQYGSMEVHPLTDAARKRFIEDWNRAERIFVDDPELAAREADRIVRDVLDERGYPGDDLDTRVAAVSVEHPKVVQRYRHGHDMVVSNGSSRAERTENLRMAMVDFRVVFVEMATPEREVAAQHEVAAH